MMEGRRSVGVTIFGVFLIFHSVVIAAFIGDFLIEKSAPDIIYNLSYIINSIIFITLIIGIFKLKNWARLIWIWGSILFIAFGWLCCLTPWNPLGAVSLGHLTYFIYPNFIGIPTLIFLTRPKVKQQFK